MKLDKAILILERELRRTITDYPDEYEEAQQLGIEGLERVRDYKAAHVELHYTPLIGETED